ncbi:hypothetical protein FA15DRAFT_85531 [Coprinopsis marcescibilis]|uniref:CENP-V/GFA domain-containing protein n=1 Tax=Coprinopsis marcescibilis TaxID=230819 RepID=A0A5C3KLV6_COPMA|nr:hypothetical protein FA15DRAFT_85531 [Coprinopsis marcescibilis]
MSSATAAAVHGSCLCKAVQYTLKGSKPLEIRVCHCVNCRKATGSAFMTNSFWFNQDFEITKGKDLLRAYRDEETASGIPIDRYFCSVCGSNIYLQSSHKKNKWVVVGLGTLDSEECSRWGPHKELFPEQRRTWIQGIELKNKVNPKL